MNKGVTEREINLFDMLWAVCQKWRSILAAAVILAVLAGGFSYMKSAKAVHAAKEAVVVTAADMYENLTYEEQKTSDVYMDYKKIYDELSYYNENAPLMKLNANDFYRGEVSFYIDNYYKLEYPVIEARDNILAMVNAYEAGLATDEFAQKLVEIIGDVSDASFALELVDCDGIYSGEKSTINVESEGVFNVFVYAPDEETCKEILTLVNETVTAQKADVTKKFDRHEIMVIQESCNRASSPELLEEQKVSADMAYNCSNNMYNMSLKFSDAQEAHINQAIAEKDADTEAVATTDETEEMNAAPTVSKKLIALGFLGGAFLMFVLWTLIYIFSNRLRLEDDFELIFGSKLLGNVPMTEKKKKWFGFIDKLFEKLRHFNQRYFETEDALDMVAANIRIAMQKAEGKSVIVTGAVCGEEEKKVAEALEKRLKKDGIEIVCESPVLYNAESLEKLAETGYAILVEKAEKSLYQEVAREIEICAQQDVSLIGTVVVY